MNPMDFLGFLQQIAQQRTLSPTPPEQGLGVRPQSDEMTRLLMNALRGDPQRGMGVNPPQGMDISPQRIIQAAMRAPGSIPMFLRPQAQDPGVSGGLEAGLKGTTSRDPGQAQVNIYPEQNLGNPSDIYNTLAHELLHAMRVNQPGLQQPGFEEAVAYHGMGAPMAAWMSQLPRSQFPQPEKQEPGIDAILRGLLSQAPPTSPSRGLPQLP